MGRFSKLLEGKGKDIKIGDEVFTIKPLSGKHIGLILELGDENKKAEALKHIILYSLQQTDPTITLEDIDELPASIINKIMEIIMNVNELDR